MSSQFIQVFNVMFSKIGNVYVYANGKEQIKKLKKNFKKIQNK